MDYPARLDGPEWCLRVPWQSSFPFLWPPPLFTLRTKQAAGFFTVSQLPFQRESDTKSFVDLTALASSAAGITWTYVNEVNRSDPEKRAYISALVSIALHLIVTRWLILALDERICLHIHSLGSHLYLPNLQAAVHRYR